MRPHTVLYFLFIPLTGFLGGADCLYLNNVTLVSLSPTPGTNFSKLCQDLNANYSYIVTYSISTGGFDFGPMILNNGSRFGSPAKPFVYDFPITSPGDEIVLFNTSMINQNQLPNPLLVASESQEEISIDLNIWMFCSNSWNGYHRVGYNVFIDDIAVVLSKGFNGISNQTFNRALLELNIVARTSVCYNNYYGSDCSIYCTKADIRGNCDNATTLAKCSTQYGILCCDDEFPGEPCTTYRPLPGSTTPQPAAERKENLYKIIMIVLACIAGVLLLGLLICLICLFCRNAKSQKKIAAAKASNQSTQTSFPAAIMGIIPSIGGREDNVEAVAYSELDYDLSLGSLASTANMQYSTLSRDPRNHGQSPLVRERVPPPPSYPKPRRRPQAQQDDTFDRWMVPVRLEGSQGSHIEHYV